MLGFAGIMDTIGTMRLSLSLFYSSRSFNLPRFHALGTPVGCQKTHVRHQSLVIVFVLRRTVQELIDVPSLKANGNKLMRFELN